MPLRAEDRIIKRRAGETTKRRRGVGSVHHTLTDRRLAMLKHKLLLCALVAAAMFVVGQPALAIDDPNDPNCPDDPNCPLDPEALAAACVRHVDKFSDQCEARAEKFADRAVARIEALLADGKDARAQHVADVATAVITRQGENAIRHINKHTDQCVAMLLDLFEPILAAEVQLAGDDEAQQVQDAMDAALQAIADALAAP